MKVDTLTDAELTALTELAHTDWIAGFDSAVMPGRLKAMKIAENMRRIMHVAVELLQHDPTKLTYAVMRMRESAKDAERELTILASLDAALQWHQGQATLLLEARRRMAVADARLKLMALEP